METEPSVQPEKGRPLRLMREARTAWREASDPVDRAYWIQQYASHRWTISAACHNENNQRYPQFWRSIHHRIEYFFNLVGSYSRYEHYSWERRPGQLVPRGASTRILGRDGGYTKEDYYLPSGLKSLCEYPHSLDESITPASNSEYGMSREEFHRRIDAFVERFLEERNRPLSSDFSVADLEISTEWIDFFDEDYFQLWFDS